jgi:hypothetical protein
VAFSVHALTGEVLHSTIRLIGREEDLDSGGWCEKKSVVTTPRTGRYSADAAGGDASLG